MINSINSKITVLINQKTNLAFENSHNVISINKILFDSLELAKPLPFANFDLSLPLYDKQKLLKLSPISLVASHNNILLQAMGDELCLTKEEINQIVVIIEPLIVDLDLTLYQHKSNLYITTSRDIKTTPCFKLKELPLTDCLPDGDDKLFWNRLFAEFQMALNKAPFNLLREQQGQPQVNTLWLWGEGEWNFSENNITILTDSEQLLEKINYSQNIMILSKANFLELRANSISETLIIYLNKVDEQIEKKILVLNNKIAINRVWQNISYLQPKKSILKRIFNIIK